MARTPTRSLWKDAITFAGVSHLTELLRRSPRGGGTRTAGGTKAAPRRAAATAGSRAA